MSVWWSAAVSRPQPYRSLGSSGLAAAGAGSVESAKRPHRKDETQRREVADVESCECRSGPDEAGDDESGNRSERQHARNHRGTGREDPGIHSKGGTSDKDSGSQEQRCYNPGGPRWRNGLSWPHHGLAQLATIGCRPMAAPRPIPMDAGDDKQHDCGCYAYGSYVRRSLFERRGARWERIRGHIGSSRSWSPPGTISRRAFGRCFCHL